MSDKDTIYRQDAIDALGEKPLAWTDSEYELALQQQWEADVDAIKAVPSAQPDLGEWCTECKEYDQKKHCCPRFNRVIREALDEVEKRKKGKWIIRDNPGTGWYRVTCSECGEDVTSTVPVIGFFPDAMVLWDYCPYCGADMRGEE